MGIWDEINQQKVVVCEPRAGDKAGKIVAVHSEYSVVMCIFCLP